LLAHDFQNENDSRYHTRLVHADVSSMPRSDHG